MKKRYKICFLLSLISAFLIFVLIAGYWLFTPLDSGQFQKDAAAARVEGLLRAPAGPLEPGPPAPNPAPKGSPAKAAPAGLERMAEICELDQLALGLDRNKFALKQLGYKTRGLNTIFLQWMLEEGFSKQPGTGRLEPGPAYKRMILEKAAATVQTARLEGANKGKADGGAALAEDPTPPAYRPALERMEKFLLAGSWTGPEFKDFPNGNFLQWISPLAALAITRRAALGEGDKAARLLERYLELLRQFHLGSFPRGDASLYEIPPLLLLLGSLEGFPEAGLERAQAVLERMHLDEKQMADFSAAHAGRLREQFLKVLEEGKVKIEPGLSGSLFGGMPARLRLRLFKPMLVREVNELTLAWAKNDPRAIFSAKRKFDVAIRAASLASEPPLTLDTMTAQAQLKLLGESPEWPAVYHLQYLSGDPRRARFNDNVDRGLLVLALVRYRRARGQYPEKIADLAPAFLAPALVAALELEWALYPLALPPQAPDSGSGPPASEADGRVLCSFRTWGEWSLPGWKKNRLWAGPLLPEEEAILKRAETGGKKMNGVPQVGVIEMKGGYCLYPITREELARAMK